MREAENAYCVSSHEGRMSAAGKLDLGALAALAALGNTIYASDGAGSTPPKTVALAFQDLLGQPTWIQANTVTFQTVLRGDINYGDKVTFPKGVMIPYALRLVSWPAVCWARRANMLSL